MVEEDVVALWSAEVRLLKYQGWQVRACTLGDHEGEEPDEKTHSLDIAPLLESCPTLACA